VSLIDLVRQNLGPNEMQQISQQLGVDPATAESAVQTALPSMVAGMAGQSQDPAGASSIQTLLGSHGGLLGNLGGMLAGAAAGNGGGGLLGGILGRHEDAVHQDVQQSTGLDSAKTKQLLMILAPIVLAALAHRHAQAAQGGNAQQPGLNDVLVNEAQQAQQQSPGVGGLLGKILSHVETPRR
jgi:hypothetical protein